MKKNFLKFGFYALFFSLLSAFSPVCLEEAVDNLRSEQKIYISSDQLKMSDVDLYIHFDSVWFQTNAVFSDENGLFIYNFWPQENGCPEEYEPCRNCKKCVKWYYDICPYCEKPT